MFRESGLSMLYMGSKARIAKHILPLMLAHRTPDQWWVEPFVGGGNMIEHVTGKRFGSDSNPYVIDALTVIRDRLDLIPRNNTEFTVTDYKTMREVGQHPLKGYVGFALSFGGKWFGGWASNKRKRDYVAGSYRSAVKQHTKLQDVVLICATYDRIIIPPSSVVYCDPPYAQSTGYRCEFDHVSFWNWCREQSHCGHTVFVSEYTAPDDFVCVWEKDIRMKLPKDNNTTWATERLFTYKGSV